VFAAVGAAVDSETDTQLFMLPLTMPLVLTFVLATSIIENPNGPLAFWLSVIPFSSPIAMMIRLPFGVPGVQLALSMGLLVLGFLFTTWLAGRIYRIGILSYGKKVTYGDLWKWIRMKP
jgi:ABC-2 type transport system permease protein